jgi:hypothetical protein
MYSLLYCFHSPLVVFLLRRFVSDDDGDSNDDSEKDGAEGDKGDVALCKTNDDDDSVASNDKPVVAEEANLLTDVAVV